MSVVKAPCVVHDPLLHTCNISVFNCDKSNSIAIRHVYNESVDFVESYAADLDINGRSNLIEIVQVIGMVLCGARLLCHMPN